MILCTKLLLDGTLCEVALIHIPHITLIYVVAFLGTEWFVCTGLPTFKIKHNVGGPLKCGNSQESASDPLKDIIAKVLGKNFYPTNILVSSAVHGYYCTTTTYVCRRLRGQKPL